MINVEETLGESAEERAQTWSKWGKVEDDVLSHLINPTLRGGPRWPAMRQAFRVVRRDGAVLVASDGLSDPFDEGKGEPGINGFGLEFYAISSEYLVSVRAGSLRAVAVSR